jgi:hypothetical protein
MRRVLFCIVLGLLQDPAWCDSLPESWSTDAECLVRTGASAHWWVDHPILDSSRVDAELSVTAFSPFSDFLITGAMSASSDSAGTAELRRARAMLQWPGTPWVGAGVRLGEGAPFTAGLHEPVIEYGWISPDSLRGMILSAGGFLGFRGSYSLAMSGGDTLASSRVRSPWLGFAGLDYSRTALHPGPGGTRGESVLNVLMIWSDFRIVKPWVLVAGADGEPGRWAVEAELRSFRPLDTGWGRLELVPGLSFAGDSFSSPGQAFTPGRRVLTLKALIRPDRYMLGAGLIGSVDLEGDSLTFVSLLGYMLSEAGISYDIRATLREDGGYSAGGEIGTASGRNASASLAAEVIDDSLRVTGRALYAPRSDVSGSLTVSGDVSGSTDPVCGLDVSALIGPATGHMGIEWRAGDVLLTVGIGGLFR